METASSSQQVMCSFNDSQVSQLEPRWKSNLYYVEVWYLS
jgi:hypothetical protein